MTLRPFSVVHSIIYDEKKGKATGVRVIDANTKQDDGIFCASIFVNAGSHEYQSDLAEFHIQSFSEWFGQ